MIIRSRGIRLFWLLGLILLLGSVVGAGWVLNQPATGTGTGASAQPQPQPQPAILGVVGHGFGDVEGGITYAHPTQPGRVVNVAVTEGLVVKKGDLLLSLDNRLQKADLDAAEAELAAAKRAFQDADTQVIKKWQHEIDKQNHQIKAARFEQTIAEFERKIAQDAYEGKYQQVSKEQFEIAKTKVERVKETIKGYETALQEIKDLNPQGTIDRAKENVKAKQAQRDKAHVALTECDLYAPADGTVLRLFVTPGDVISSQPRQAAVQFCPNKPRIIRMEILQEFASKVQKGQVAFIEDDTRAGVQWKGKVERVSDWFAPRRSILQEPFQYNDVRTLECIVYLDPGSAPVRIGQRVRVTIKQGGP